MAALMPVLVDGADPGVVERHPLAEDALRRLARYWPV
jgi:hypothetical protein